MNLALVCEIPELQYCEIEALGESLIIKVISRFCDTILEQLHLIRDRIQYLGFSEIRICLGDQCLSVSKIGF